MPAEVTRVTWARMFGPGPTSVAMPDVKTAPDLKETLYGVPTEQVTFTLEVAVSVPTIVAKLPKFIVEAVIAQV